jgi:SAM-dependent methyltransferase
LQSVLNEASKIVGEFGVSQSFRMQPGDYRKDELGAEYDVVIFGNICHIETPDGNRALIGRAFRALKRGGRLVIGDMVPNEDRSGPPFPVMFALNMLLHSGGDTYTFSEYRRWLEEEGFRQAEAFETHRSHSPVIIATR